MSSAAPNDRRWNFARAGAVVVYLLCASLLGFRSPGMYYDEAIFLNGAVHMLNSGGEPPFPHDPWSWGKVFGRRLPVMVMPYVGAIRNYLVLIPYAIFGPNYYTSRIPTALVGAFGIWGLSILMRDHIGAKAAAMASLALAIHPAYLALTLYDQGVAEWIAPFGALCITLARYLRRCEEFEKPGTDSPFRAGRLRIFGQLRGAKKVSVPGFSNSSHRLRAPAAGRALWLGVAMGFGVWSRANIVWLLAAAALAGFIVLGKRMFIPGRHLAALVAGAFIGGAPLLWYEVRSGGATFAFLRTMADTKPLSQLALLRLDLLSHILLSNRGQLDTWNAPPMPFWQVMTFSSVVAIGLYVCLRRRGAFGRAAALTFLFLLALMLLSRLNVTEHHLIALVPFAAVLVAVAAQDICGRWPNARYAAGVVAVVWVGCALYWNLVAARRIGSTGGTGLWSDSIDTVRDYLERNHAGKKVKVLDWGLNNNLYVLSGSRIASAELFWGATAERSGSGKLWEDEISPGDVYVQHAPAVLMFPEASDAFRRKLAASGLAYRRVAFLQRSGAGYAEAVEILPSAGRAAEP